MIFHGYVSLPEGNQAAFLARYGLLRPGWKFGVPGDGSILCVFKKSIVIMNIMCIYNVFINIL